jgi:hypothetical protein
MSSFDCGNLAALAQVNSPATEDQITLLEQSLGLILPDMYRALLRCANGFTAQEDICSLILYSTEELIERNETYEVSVYAPELLMIGDDGGGRAILIERHQPDPAVYRVSMGSISPDDAVTLAPQLSSWITQGLNLELL